MYRLKNTLNLAKLVSIHFKVKFGPDLVCIINLVNSQNQTEFINYTDFTQVKFNFTGFKFLIRSIILNTY
jgi:hypothetical protein